jgi:DNA-directed RNA polymerase subunit E'
MFYFTEAEDYIRVEPKFFGLETREAVRQQLSKTYSGFLNKEIGFVISIVDVLEVHEGIVIPGDGAVYYNSKFVLLAWRPELQEPVFGIIKEVANFGAFMNVGPAEGLIHITQVTDDYVSFSKSGSLTSKSGKRNIKKGDVCLARVVAISYKAGEPKIGLTMRQPGLGKLDWIKEEKRRSKTKSSSGEGEGRGEKSSKKSKGQEKGGKK